MKEADAHLKKWYKAFPKVKLCMGNHDELVSRQAIDKGIPQRVIKSFSEIWDFPKGWKVDWKHELDEVKYLHGTGTSGRYPHVTIMSKSQQSVVIGHCHSVAGVYWMANDHNICFAMAVGSGIERNSYAFDYGKNHTVKPILGCGVVFNHGEDAQFIPMNLGKKVIYTNY
jgi:hypothetical protein